MKFCNLVIFELCLIIPKLMKHIFVINPSAGKGKSPLSFIPYIKEVSDKNNLDYEIYITTRKLDALDFVRNRAKSKEKLRFYSCGGEGTLFEVLNGAFGFDNVEITSIPLGSGNDFVRFFGGAEKFLNLENLINGNVILLDLIKCGDMYAINQCSMGLDAEIAGMQEKFKKIPLISGAATYYLAIFYCLLRKIGNRFKVQIDDEIMQDDSYLFCLAANSKWYGGGFFSAPSAEPDDGLIDFILVRKTMGRFALIPLISKYKKGEHLNWNFTKYTKGTKMTVKSDKPVVVNLDGECFYQDFAEFEIIKKGIKYVCPFEK